MNLPDILEYKHFLFCRIIDTEEVTVPLISPVKPLTIPIGRICLCHKIKNDFQTQPPLQSGFLRPNWLVVERARKSYSKDCQCPSGADTLSPGPHANTQLGRGHAILPFLNYWSPKQWQEAGTVYEVFSSNGSIWAVILLNKWAQTQGKIKQGPLLRMGLLLFFNMFSFFLLKSVILWHIRAHRQRPQCAILTLLCFSVSSSRTSSSRFRASEWSKQFREFFWLEGFKSKYLVY